MLQDAGCKPLVRSEATIMQLNIGLYCNQACTHCHVESSPKRTEMMDHATAKRCLQLLKASPHIKTLDITGTPALRATPAPAPPLPLLASVSVTRPSCLDLASQ